MADADLHTSTGQPTPSGLRQGRTIAVVVLLTLMTRVRSLTGIAHGFGRKLVGIVDTSPNFKMVSVNIRTFSLPFARFQSDESA
ncbi:MAG: hypothetical protein OXU68_04135 [Bacteroidota bacterium]|nr:hypothetical protein [Bacteroidota bacterium]